MCFWNSPQRTSFVMILAPRFPLKRNGKIAVEACEKVSHFLLSSPEEAPALQSFVTLKFIFNTARILKKTRQAANHTVPLVHLCCDTHKLREKRDVRFCLNYVIYCNCVDDPAHSTGRISEYRAGLRQEAALIRWTPPGKHLHCKHKERLQKGKQDDR